MKRLLTGAIAVSCCCALACGTTEVSSRFVKSAVVEAGTGGVFAVSGDESAALRRKMVAPALMTVANRRKMVASALMTVGLRRKIEALRKQDGVMVAPLQPATVTEKSEVQSRRERRPVSSLPCC